MRVCKQGQAYKCVEYLHSRETLLLTVSLCVDSDSEMEIEAEHYSNGVTESSTRIMNGTYKHQEILQADDSSVGNGVAGTTRVGFLTSHSTGCENAFLKM